jgi:hypothetical protein
MRHHGTYSLKFFRAAAMAKKFAVGSFHESSMGPAGTGTALM